MGGGVFKKGDLNILKIFFIQRYLERKGSLTKDFLKGATRPDLSSLLIPTCLSQLWLYREQLVNPKVNPIWVSITNTDFLILISLQPDVVDFRYFKFIVLQLDQITKDLHHQVAKM